MPGHKEQIQRFYRKFAPNSQVDADKLLKKYKGSESALLSEIYIKYLLADEQGDGSGTPFEEAIKRLYAHYVPNKSQQVPGLVSKYQDIPDKLITEIVNKYEFHDAPIPIGAIPAAASPKSKLTDIYRIHNPEKVAEIDNLLEKYKGREGDLVRAVSAKYKPRATSSNASQDSFKSKLTEFYRRHNPSRIAKADELARKYKGNEATLLATLEAKYHPKRSELVSLYTKYNPGKVNDVDQLLIKYKGREDKLIQQIKAKYEGMKEEVTKTPPINIGTPSASAAPMPPTTPATSTPSPPPAPAATPPPSIPKEALTITTKADAPVSSDTLNALASDSLPHPEASPGPEAAEPPGVPPGAEPTVSSDNSASPQSVVIDSRNYEEEHEKLAQKRAKGETDRKAAEELPVKEQEARQQIPNASGADEQKRKAAVVVAATTTQKSAKAKPKGQKKKSLAPLFTIVAVVLVLGAGVGGYYYKFGFSFPFFIDSTQAKDDASDKSGSVAVIAPVVEKEPEESAVELAASELVVEEAIEEEELEQGEVEVEPDLSSDMSSEAPAKEEAPEESESKPTPTPVATARPAAGKNLKYHLAAGSFTLEQNARDLHDQLKSQGYESVYLGRIGDYYKVSYQSFKNEADAKAALQALKDKGVSSWMIRHELK